jgi:hypothetical protein
MDLILSRFRNMHSGHLKSNDCEVVTATGHLPATRSGCDCDAVHLVSDREDPVAAIVRCTADPAKADKRTRSKWSRVMRYAAAYKPDSEPVDEFVQRKGGINACAARFSRRLGRGTRSERRTAGGVTRSIGCWGHAR